MDLLWMILPLFLVSVSAEAKNVTEIRRRLGQNVTLRCSEHISNMHWLMEIYDQFPVCIFRTFSPNSEPVYCSANFKTKFSVLNNSLVITHITAGDYRLYFCARRQNDTVIYVDTLRLVSDDPTAPSANISERQEHHDGAVWQSNYLTYGSLALNVFLVLILTGWVCRSLSWKKKKKDFKVNDHSGITPDNTEMVEAPQVEAPQYEEIQLSGLAIPPPAVSTECIYYKAQRPQSTLLYC